MRWIAEPTAEERAVLPDHYAAEAQGKMSMDPLVAGGLWLRGHHREETLPYSTNQYRCQRTQVRKLKAESQSD